MARTTKTPLERSTENRFVLTARKEGAITRKMNGLGNRAWPDQWVLPPNGLDYLIEFKRSKKRPTKLQADLHTDLRARGKTVMVHDDYEEAMYYYRTRASIHIGTEDWRRLKQRSVGG